MGQGSQTTKTAVVLLNLGGPKALDEVEPFLMSLFSDPAIVTLPNPFRYVLAKWITKKRLPEAHHIYSLLGGGSPLLENTEAQATALSKELGEAYRVFVSMRHAAPKVNHALDQVNAYRPDKVILLPLYPQYSTTTTGSAFKAWEKATKDFPCQTTTIHSYPSQGGFVEAIGDLFTPIYKEALSHGTPRILLTAHGLPEKTIRAGDPYQSHVEETAGAFLEAQGPLDAVLCYQSRVGRLKWTGPYTEDEIVRASQEKRPLIVVPLSFVSEHSETLVELDMTYKKLALEKGCPAYFRVPTVGCHPSFIKGLAELVHLHLSPCGRGRPSGRVRGP